MVKLQIKDDQGKTTVVEMKRDETTVGRKEGNTIRLTERNVSRTHARFVKKGDEVLVEDLSRYGTRINGERIGEPKRIFDDDVVVIGDYELSLDGVVRPEPAAAPPAASGDSDGKDAEEGPTPLEKAARRRLKEAKADSGPAAAPTPPKVEAKASRGKGKKRIEANQPMLVAVTTDLGGTAYPIDDGTLIIGRTGENDIQVEHHSISRNHAKIVAEGGSVKMVDLASKNGIRVNGEFWEESVLKSGDEIELGKVRFRFVEAGEDFIYRPEDWTEAGKKAAATIDTPDKGGSKAWIFILLLLVAGGVAAVFVLTQGETEVSNIPTSPTAADATAATAVPPETTAPPETPPPVEQPSNNQAVTEALTKAKAAVASEKWVEAKKQVDMVLALDAGNPEGNRLGKTIAQEQGAKAALALAQAALSKDDLQGAYAELSKLSALPTASRYYARYKEMMGTVGPGIANGLVDEAKAALGKKHYNEAIKKADEALAIQADNTEAQEVKARAKRAKAKAAANRRPAVVKKPPVKTPPIKTAPVDSGKTAKDYYKEARKVHNSDPKAALTLYKKAASKGYAKAYKQMGGLYMKLGKTGDAIKAYKRYLSLVPGAADAAVIKDIITRLGGTP